MHEKLFNPDYLLSLCQKYRLTPTKRYGQNFLINPEPIEAMITAAEITKDDTVIEVGPGFGVLSFALAEKAKKVIAFEIEKKLQSYWDQILNQVQDDKYKNLEIVWGNALKNQKLNIKNQKYKVAANLPYQITSNVIRKFLESAPPAGGPPETMTLMVQKEVGERICAPAGEMSLLSVAVQYYAQPEIIATVLRNNFWPEPGVDSIVIKLKVYKVTKSSDETERFFNLVRLGFANRRKFLIKNLSSLAKKSDLATIFTQIGLQPTARAQELSMEEWGRLAGSLGAGSKL
jgi:16S rRNA (adenine1518-N6/adenine1519-N6)-dimethyltransferase